MGWVLFADQARAGKIEELDSGMVRVRGRVARTGVQMYAPWPGAPIQDRAIRVYRPPGEVFADSSLKTLAGTPITIGHPKERSVTAENWKRYAVGHNEGETKRISDEGEEYVETSLLVADAEAVQLVKDKKLTEISQGYTVELDWSPGTTIDGQQYDAVQTQISHNHTALLGAGDARAGKGARVLLDSATLEEKKYMKKEKFRELLSKAVKEVDAKVQKDVEAFVSDAVSPMLDSLGEEEITKLVSHAVKASASKFADEGEEEEKKKEDEEEEEEEKKKEDEEEEEEEKKKEEANDAKRRGAELVKTLADAKQETIAVIDARADVREMVGDEYNYKGKSVKQLHLDAIEAVAPKVAKRLKEEKANDAMVAGAFEAIKGSRTSWVKNDGAEPTGPSEHVKSYEKKMNDAFESTWGEA